LSIVKHHKRRFEVDDLRGDIRNINPPTLIGNHKKDEDAKAWLLGMMKCWNYCHRCQRIYGITIHTTIPILNYICRFTSILNKGCM